MSAVNRRDLLTRGALALGAAAVAGCTEQTLEAAESQPPPLEERFDEADLDLPVEQAFERAAAGVAEADGETFADRDALGSFLGEHDLTVESLHAVEAGETEVLELAYADDRQYERGVLYGLGLISGGYAALVAGGDPPLELAAELHDENGETFASFDVTAHESEQYRAGELTARAYANEVGDTLETTR